MLRCLALCVAHLAASFCMTTAAFAGDSAVGSPQRLAGLREPAKVTVDDEGISHVRASNEHDLYLMQGCVHSRDRLLQMDHNRQLARRTLPAVLRTAPLTTELHH